MARYLDQGYPLLHWASTIEAIGPKCQSVGVINGSPAWNNWHANFFCHNCSHTIRTDRDGWKGPVIGMGSRPCRYCDHLWVRLEREYESCSRVTYCSAHAPCPTCGTDNEVELKFTRAKSTDHTIDPYFGLELAFKESTRHGSVWIYNAVHLQHLKAYISAQHRVSSGTKCSFFTHFPARIKTAKSHEISHGESLKVSKSNREQGLRPNLIKLRSWPCFFLSPPQITQAIPQAIPHLVCIPQQDPDSRRFTQNVIAPYNIPSKRLKHKLFREVDVS